MQCHQIRSRDIGPGIDIIFETFAEICIVGSRLNRKHHFLLFVQRYAIDLALHRNNGCCLVIEKHFDRIVTVKFDYVKIPFSQLFNLHTP